MNDLTDIQRMARRLLEEPGISGADREMLDRAAAGEMGDHDEPRVRLLCEQREREAALTGRPLNYFDDTDD